MKLSDTEKTKLQSLSRLFLYKVAESIYETRSPQDLPDFEPEQPQVLSLGVRKSSSLRSLLTYKSHYGWFQVDIILTNPDIVIERWHLIHLPLKAEYENTYSSPRDLREHIFRRFSQFLRSIYSMSNVLPAKTLQLQLKQLPTNERKLKVVCEPFHALPAVYESISEYETARLQFGPIVTPVGRSVVFVTHRIDLDNEINQTIRTAQHYTFSSSRNSGIMKDLIQFPPSPAMTNEFAGNEPIATSYDPTSSALMSNFSQSPGSFSSLRMEDFTHFNQNNEENQDSQTDSDIQVFTLNELEEMIQNCMKEGFNDKTSVDEIRKRFNEVSNEIDEFTNY